MCRVFGPLHSRTASSDDRHARPLIAPRGTERRYMGVDRVPLPSHTGSSRKHHRSVLRYRPDRGRDHAVGADPSQGIAGRVRKLRRCRLGVGPPEGSGRAFFAFSVPQGLPGAIAGTSRVSITNPGIQATRRVLRNPPLARRSMTKCHVSGRRANQLPVLRHSPRSLGNAPRRCSSPSTLSRRPQSSRCRRSSRPRTPRRHWPFGDRPSRPRPHPGWCPWR